MVSADIFKEQVCRSDWDLHAQLYAFLGNSFLGPMDEELSIGLTDTFWSMFASDGDNEHVRHGIERLVSFARSVQDMPREQAMQKVNVEYAQLFIGPPRPQAVAWESMAQGCHVGFGEPTFIMRSILRNAQLSIAGPSNQYEDHIGIELMFISACCQKFAENTPSIQDEMGVREFIEQHPLSWIEVFYNSVKQSAPDGYYAGLAELTWGLLQAEV